MHVLLVEDEQKISYSIKKGLEQEHYTVDVAHTGTSGLEFALDEEYDVMILDLMLPEMDGMQVCREVRKNSVKIPILMLTARGQVREKVDGLNAGADDYLTKPFAFEELLARLKAITRRPNSSVETVLFVDNLTMNTLTYRVMRADTSIDLSHREYTLLEYFIRHKNQVITKDQLILHVWNYDADILTNTVEVYIGYLRNKIDKKFPDEPALIHTIRGFGYRIGSGK